GATSSCSALFSNIPFQTMPGCGPATPFTGPLLADPAGSCGYPPGTFPACDPTAARTIPLSGTLRLGPGTYGNVFIAGRNRHTGGVLVLSGGVYHFCSIRASHGGQLRVEGPAQIYVANELVFNSETFVGPAGTDGRPAVAGADIQLFVGNGRIL